MPVDNKQNELQRGKLCTKNDNSPPGIILNHLITEIKKSAQKSRNF